MRMTLAVITSILLTFAAGCGDSDTAEPGESNEPVADAGVDASEGDSEEEPETDPEPTKDDDPEAEPRVMHTRINGDIDNPVTCDEVCAGNSMVCDPEYHTFIGTGGCKAKWGPVEDMLRCDEAPKTLKTSYTGNVFELSEFECYCLATSE